MAAEVRQTKQDEICDSNGRFSRLFWKVKKERKLVNKCFFKRYERKQNHMHGREFSKLIWPQSNNLQTKLIQSSFTKIARIYFGCQLWWFGFVWTKNFALQLWLFPQHQIFFEQSCVTRAFILSQTISKKHHQKLICGTVNNIKGWFVEQDLFLVTWLHVLSVTNKSCLQDSQTSFLFWQKRARILRVPAQKLFSIRSHA